MLMVIFGAGASYDCVSSRSVLEWTPERNQYRLPLARQLFDDRGIFNLWINNFPRCKPVIPRLRKASRDGSVESELEKLRAEGLTYPDRYKQLAAVQFYLQSMLWDCEKNLKSDPGWSVTNYMPLLDQIHSWRGVNKQACLVTFNYDTMLEDALALIDIKINSLPDYISSDGYKIIKLHGSVNWAHRVMNPIKDIKNLSTLDVANELIDRAAELDIHKEFHMTKEYPSSKLGELALFPALAIPVETKQNYECPPEHLEALRKCLPEVTKILLIGWRATESLFLQLLSDNLRKEVHVMTVAGGTKEAEKSNRRLQEAGIKGKFFTGATGFSDFVVHHEGDGFLRS